VWESPAVMSVTGWFSVLATWRGVFSAPGLPRAPSSLQPQVQTVPFDAKATVCIPPQTSLNMDLAGMTLPISKIVGFLGFLISNGASSPNPAKRKQMVSLGVLDSLRENAIKKREFFWLTYRVIRTHHFRRHILDSFYLIFI
jgi:hypothetical protein